MTVFGWITLVIWAGMFHYSPQSEAKMLCLFMIAGTLAWGTGSL